MAHNKLYREVLAFLIATLHLAMVILSLARLRMLFFSLVKERVLPCDSKKLYAGDEGHLWGEGLSLRL